jgi:hypothetical protein
MKAEQARRLRVGEEIVWRNSDQVDSGVIVERGQFGVTVRWSDGRTTELFFNDMGNVERAIRRA